MNKFPGRRVKFPEEPLLLPVDVQDRLKVGDYWHFEPHKIWLVCSPNGELGSIRSDKWTIVEHEDGTITVNPSIQFYTKDAMQTKGWHGYLVRGVWVES